MVHGDDGLHDRWFRACALLAERVLRPAVAAGRVLGRVDGLLRLESGLPFDAMQARLAARGLPHAHVHALHPADASARSGVALSAPAWCYPGGGWVAPGDMVRDALAQEGITLRTASAVARIAPSATGWRLFDGEDRCVEEANAVVLAGGADALMLADPPCPWPLQRVRGQITLLPAAPHDRPQPALPVAGQGYAIGLPDGRLLCGATSQIDDPDPSVRADDHRQNLDRLHALTGWPPGDAIPPHTEGRVGWRCTGSDRLPVIGPWPDAATPGQRLDQPRLWPRVNGLYACTALGSRGIAQSLLGGEVLAAWITGAPMPLPASLLDAVDAARFVAKAARRPGLKETPGRPKFP